MYLRVCVQQMHLINTEAKCKYLDFASCLVDELRSLPFVSLNVRAHQECAKTTTMRLSRQDFAKRISCAALFWAVVVCEDE